VNYSTCLKNLHILCQSHDHPPTAITLNHWTRFFLPLKGMSIAFGFSIGALICTLSVCLSVRLSHALIVTNLNDALQVFWYCTKAQSLCYSDTNSGWWVKLPSLWNLRWKWPIPFEKRRLRRISAHNVSTVRDSEKSSITTNIKSTMGFRLPTSHRWSAYATPKSP